MKMMLFSNSTNAGENYLAYTLPYFSQFLDNKPAEAVFVPYAGVTIHWDNYSNKVAGVLNNLGIKIFPLHQTKNEKQALENASMIMVGGGNTFHLLKTLQDKDLLEVIRKKVRTGTPYIGWSAGSNLACPTICTTNDMPIVEPHNFSALGLIPFQINPHYTDATLENHAGETREMRIEEYLVANQKTWVAGMREGTLFRLDGDTLTLQGEKACRVFRYGDTPKELNKTDNFSFLFK